ncbi:MAG: hypothetical protein EXX96DRAFT_537558 [Benjaminiella poitrasii]|nr:MAG: hypothetical protein EXX96DRAFT_537558 [Benjaminiella poitrasii]
MERSIHEIVELRVMFNECTGFCSGITFNGGPANHNTGPSVCRLYDASITINNIIRALLSFFLFPFISSRCFYLILAVLLVFVVVVVVVVDDAVSMNKNIVFAAVAVAVAVDVVASTF